MNGNATGYAQNGNGNGIIEFDEMPETNQCCNLTTRGKMKALLQKNFLRIRRNVGVMLFIFALPVMQVILFCLAIGREPTGLKIAIANMEMNDTIVSAFGHHSLFNSIR